MRSHKSFLPSLIILLVSAVGIVGCSTTPVSTDTATPVPLARIYHDSHKAKSTEFREIVILRDRGFVGGGATARLYLDDKLVLDMMPGEIASLFVSPGEHTLTCEPVAMKISYDARQRAPVENGRYGGWRMGRNTDVTFSTALPGSIRFRIYYPIKVLGAEDGLKLIRVEDH